MTLPKHLVKNEDFLTHSFYTKTGEKIQKPSKDIVQKLEEISGIVERRYIGKDEEYSIDLLPAKKGRKQSHNRRKTNAQ